MTARPGQVEREEEFGPVKNAPGAAVCPPTPKPYGLSQALGSMYKVCPVSQFSR